MSRSRSRARRLTAALAAGAGAAALATSQAAAAPAAEAATAPAAAISATNPCGALPASSAPATFDHVVLLMFENKPLKKIVGNRTDAPYLNSLVDACSYAKNDLSLSITSLANYVALTSGYTGCTAIDASGTCTSPKLITSNLDPKVWPQASRSIFELMGANAVQWGESQPGNCPITEKSADYAINHTPFAYYTRTQTTLCPQNARPFPANVTTTLSAKFNLVIPNKKDIMHLVPGTSIAQRIQNGDKWASTYLPQLLNSPEYQSGKTAIIITWDEGNNSTFTVPLIVLTPYTTVKGASSVSYNHYSVLKGIQQMVGVAPLLGHAGDAGVASIRDDAQFGLKPA